MPTVKVRTHREYTLEIDEETFPIPFNDETGAMENTAELIISQDGLRAVVGCLCADDSPEDPFEMWDEGEFFQFSNRYIHHTPRPDIEEFKRIVRQNPGRVFLLDIYDYGSGGTSIKVRSALTPQDTRGDKHTGENSKAEQELDDADGYYICPSDVTDPQKYAEGALKAYESWCNGDVYGVCLWFFERDYCNFDLNGTGIAADGLTNWELIEDEREEVWGYYGDDAKQELKSALEAQKEKINEPRPERTDPRQMALGF
jgi:hypothetical protein